jgi:hypothetical protein
MTTLRRLRKGGDKKPAHNKGYIAINQIFEACAVQSRRSGQAYIHLAYKSLLSDITKLTEINLK